MKRIFLTMFILFFLFLKTSYAQEKVENSYVTVELLDNTDVCFTDCEATIRVCEKGDVYLWSDNFEVWFEDETEKELGRLSEDNFDDTKFRPPEKTGLVFKEDNGLLNYQILQQKNITYYESVDYYEDVVVCYDEPIDNKTEKTKEVCHYEPKLKNTTVYTRQKTVFESWNPKEFSKDINGCAILKIKGNKKAMTGDNNIDWRLNIFGLEPAWDWWNSSYNYKKSVNFTDVANIVDLDNYPISFWFAHEGHNNSDCSDFVIINASDNTTMDYGINVPSCNNTHVKLAVKTNITQGGTTELFVYYGFATADFSQNLTWKNATHNFYEDFDGDLDQNTWDNTSTISGSEFGYASGGKLIIGTTSGGGTMAVYTKHEPFSNYAIITMNLKHITGDAGERCGGGSGGHYTADKKESFEDRWGTNNPKYYYGDGEDDFSSWAAGSYAVERNVTMFINTTHINYTDSLGAVSGAADYALQGTYPDPFYFYLGLDSGPETAEYYNVTIRNYIEPNPTVTVGTEEEYPTTSTTSTSTTTTLPPSVVSSSDNWYYNPFTEKLDYYQSCSSPAASLGQTAILNMTGCNITFTDGFMTSFEGCT